MGLDDFVETEVGVAVAATSVLLSRRVRGVLRRGTVYGLAGALTAGDAVASAARGIAGGVRGAATEKESGRPARAEAKRRPAAARPRGAARPAGAPKAKPAAEAKAPVEPEAPAKPETPAEAEPTASAET